MRSAGIGLELRGLKQLPVIKEQHPQLHAQCPCERDSFSVCHAAVAGFNFGDRVFGAIPPAPCAACRQIALPQPRVSPCFGEVRADDIFRLASSRRHLPFSEEMLDSQRPRCSSDNGRFQKNSSRTPFRHACQRFNRSPAPCARQSVLCDWRECGRLHRHVGARRSAPKENFSNGAAVGPGGQVGAWSDPAKIVVQ